MPRRQKITRIEISPHSSNLRASTAHFLLAKKGDRGVSARFGPGGGRFVRTRLRALATRELTVWLHAGIAGSDIAYFHDGIFCKSLQLILSRSPEIAKIFQCADGGPI